MQPGPKLRRGGLHALAVIFAAVSLAYGAIWMHYIPALGKAELGVRYVQPSADPYIHVTRVLPGSPAEAAGIRHADHIVAVNGTRMRNWAPFFDAVSRGLPGDKVKLTIQRSGREFDLEATLAPPPPPGAAFGALSPLKIAVLSILLYYPVPFLAVGLTVLFLRVHKADAWLVALMFSAFLAQAFTPGMEGLMPPGVRRFVAGYVELFQPLVFPLFYFFFATFPARSPLDRRAPWLKWLFLGGTGLVAVPAGALVFLDGTMKPAAWASRFQFPFMHLLMVMLGLTSLALNAARAGTTEARRKSRVLLWGTFASMVPLLALAAWMIAVRPPADLVFAEYIPGWIPFWLWVLTPAGLLLLPLSFGYAVLKHRVLDVPVLLRRSARYLLVQNGFVALMIVVSAIAIVALAGELARLLEGRQSLAVTTGAAFGGMLVWAGARVHRSVSVRIDRAFFRSAYDARRILEDLAESARRLTDRNELARELNVQLNAALHPTSILIYLEAADGELREHPPGETGGALPPGIPALAEAKQDGRPWRVKPGSPESLGALAPLRPECLVPVQAHDGRLAGLIVLGPRLSEEPYSSEDLRLLGSVATQAGAAIENICLAEEIAQHHEEEKVAAREMEIAVEVQRKLLPYRRPALRTLDYGGLCQPARAIGGDYYDFLELGPGQIGMLLADICGKGISAALLMANLQACIRSQAAQAIKDVPELLGRVNSLLYDSTEPQHFATLFFAIYDDPTGRLTYANCGHCPPLLLRADGSLERLEPTATVVGAFPRWHTGIESVLIGPGDTLAVFTDGITEASDESGRDFGERRLIDLLERTRELPVDEAAARVLQEVREFSAGKQQDDITLVLARGV